MDDDTDTFTCDSSNKTHTFYLSEFCTNGTYDKDNCILDLDEKIPFRAGLGVWGLIVMVFGVFGNLFTLISVPYASKRRR